MAFIPLRKGQAHLFDFNINRMFKELYGSMSIGQAENVILKQYGDTVSAEEKGKNLNKFGRTSTNVGTTFATVGEFQDAVVDETFETTNVIDSIVSTNAGDTQNINLEGFTIDGSGNLTFVTQSATLTGQTEVTLTTPMARCGRAYVAPSTVFGTTPSALAGNMAVYDNAGGITAGKPDVDTAVKAMILAGTTQSEKCATSTSFEDYWIISSLTAQIFDAAPTTDFVTVRIETRDIVNGGAWRPLGGDIVAVPGAFTAPPQEFDPYRIVPKNHDVRAVAKTDAGTAPVFAEIEGVLAVIV